MNDSYMNNSFNHLSEDAVCVRFVLLGLLALALLVLLLVVVPDSASGLVMVQYS
jgi:hypothetical protein